ncbi:helix-turn-helix transcriptional regulator [Bradyrhizobium huanghuaihaiense]|uniref:AraC family transcriptional regulator n=1 Tax=Bradyrhizobium huanghuaihaiense TaxID=990078 RepID=UPI0021AAD579|nr:helix-turn-helix transcriptional regulator [Bradyrhizobium sp. CB3035]UWU75269.1 helix-turn-helix transcriptional regulator [Bradyrhizobium sp. CB3035]
MSMKRQSPKTIGWKLLQAPPGLGSPRPMIVRVQSLPPRSYFAEHSHTWSQLVYAIAGALTVNANGRSLVISPEQAVWLPTGTAHSVGSLMGAEFRSLWVADVASRGMTSRTTVMHVSALLRALIVEAASLKREDRRYANRVTALILDQLRRATPIAGALPWPSHPSLLALCESLYADPANPRHADKWGREIGMSARTLTRHFESEVGMSLRAWRQRVRLFKAIELLGSDLPITEIALRLGYSSASAFIFMFRSEMSVSPLQYRRNLSRSDGARTA